MGIYILTLWATLYLYQIINQFSIVPFYKNNEIMVVNLVMGQNVQHWIPVSFLGRRLLIFRAFSLEMSNIKINIIESIEYATGGSFKIYFLYYFYRSIQGSHYIYCTKQ